MNIIENIKEGFRSIQSNLLRSVLTALIIAIGITSLVGILTAIDAIEFSVNDSLSSLGVNTFDIKSKVNRSSNTQGIMEKTHPTLMLNEAFQFIESYPVQSSISLSANLSGAAEVKRLSIKTNPNITIMGVNDEFLSIKGLSIDQGRNFSNIETQYGNQVAILGHRIYTTLFTNNQNAIGEEVTFMGAKFRVIGITKEKGKLAEDNYDNMILIPIIKANQMAQGKGLSYDLTIGINDPAQVEYAMGEARGLMRKIRHDQIGKEDSFELAKSETLAKNLESITSALRLGGFGVGFITLLGAAIALMNIMLVSVTERTREVGVRKALGATPLRIRQQFVIEAIIVCVIGGITGVGLGILIGNGIAKIMGIQTFIVPWLWMSMGMVVCVLVGLLSGYYPAYKASKLDPIESLRFE